MKLKKYYNSAFNLSKYFEEEKWVKRIDLVFHGSVLSVRTDSAF